MFVQLYAVNIKHSHWWKPDSTVADGTCEETMAYYNIYVLYRYVSVYAVTINYSNYMRTVKGFGRHKRTSQRLLNGSLID
jgi:hypothetical protein